MLSLKIERRVVFDPKAENSSISASFILSSSVYKNLDGSPRVCMISRGISPIFTSCCTTSGGSDIIISIALPIVLAISSVPRLRFIAISSKNEADIRQFNTKLVDYKKERKQLQKKLARSIRLSNPECFKEDTWVKKDKHWKKKLGKNIKGKRYKVKSKNYLKNKEKLKQNYSKSTALRNQSQGELLNFLLSLGNNFQTEKVSIKAWQKRWGKSILNAAPSETITKLRRKAENAGGKVVEFSTYHTKLSQTCICGNIQKKSLSERYHNCDKCGLKDIQRDLLSAHLARFVIKVDDKDRLDVKKAKRAFKGAETRLRNVASMAKDLVRTKASSNCYTTIYLKNAVKSNSRVREVNISNSKEKQLEIISIKCN